jgi:pimeloyl-ACP methyl ester carboxylesterase
MPAVEGAGVELAYRESGSGPAVVLVHGMAADRESWPAEIRGARVIAYDRRGYGSSGAPEPYDRTTVAEQAEDLAALVGRLGADPAVAAGADFGALVVLDVLKRHPGRLRAAVLVDPPVFQLVDAFEPLAAERAALEDALRAGGRERGVEIWLAARGVADAERLERARRDAQAFFADWGGQASLPLSRRELRAIDVPVVVLDSAHAPAHARAASDALARLLGDARRGGAEDVAEAIAALLG